jgi:hypothetical protein
MVTAWVYDHKYLNDDFNYEDLEKQYLDAQAGSGSDPSALKKELDAAHKN